MRNKISLIDSLCKDVVKNAKKFEMFDGDVSYESQFRENGIEKKNHSVKAGTSEPESDD